MSRLTLLCVFVVSLFASIAHAHDPFETTTMGRLYADRMDLIVIMNRNTAMAVGLNKPDERPFKAEEFESVKPQLTAAAPLFYQITTPAGPILHRTVSVVFTDENELEFTLTYPRPPPGPVRFSAEHLLKLGEGYGDMLNLVDMTPPSVLCFQLLTKEQPGFDVTVPPAQVETASASTTPAATTTAPAEPYAAPRISFFSKFFKLGIQHILKGYDHLLFLAGLLVVCTRVRSTVTIITCFTVAHSITLALAALDIVAISGRIIEPLIAASICFVGIENLIRRGEPKGRWLVTFTFGLIHGFGFASVLRDIGLGENGTSLVVPLFAFNIGVETGQLAVAAIFLPLLWRLRQWPAFARRGPMILSIIVAAAGAYWLIERLMDR